MSTNPICIGFAWSQAFDFPYAFLQGGDQIRADLRQDSSDEPVTVSDGAGTRIDDNRVFVTLTEAQTATFSEGTVRTNFVVVRGEEEIAVPAIVTIPVVLLPTRPQP